MSIRLVQNGPLNPGVEMPVSFPLCSLSEILPEEDHAFLSMVLGNRRVLANDQFQTCIVDSENVSSTLGAVFVTMNQHVENEESTLLFGNSVCIDFHRTWRVSDDGNTNSLPPSVGVFPIEKLENGNFAIPMYQAEAMWINFSQAKKDSPYAIKVSTGDVCALTGSKHTPGLSQTPQNYMVCPPQPWIDGVVDHESADTVRQFVAMPILSHTTVEQQMVKTGEIDKVSGGLTIQVFKLAKLPPNVSVYRSDTCEFVHTDKLESSLQELNIPIGTRLYFFYDYPVKGLPRLYTEPLQNLGLDETSKICVYKGSIDIFVKTLTGKNIPITVSPDFTVYELKLRVQESEGIPPDQQRFSFCGVMLEENKRLRAYNIEVNGCIVHLILRLRGGGYEPTDKMALAAGGRIRQKIYKDDGNVNRFALAGKCTLHILNTVSWKQITGQDPPKPVLSRQFYDKHLIQWKVIYNENLPSVNGKRTRGSTVSETTISKKTVRSLGENLVDGLDEHECSKCHAALANVYIDKKERVCGDCFKSMDVKEEKVEFLHAHVSLQEIGNPVLVPK